MTLAGISLKIALQACWLLYVGWETTWAMLVEGPARSKALQKAMLVIFQHKVWQHYFYSVFLCGFLWMFKGTFDMETLLASLKSSKRQLAATKAVPTPMWTDPSTQKLSL